MARHHQNPIGDKSGCISASSGTGSPALTLIGIVGRHLFSRAVHDRRCGSGYEQRGNQGINCSDGKPRSGDSWGGGKKPPGC